MTTNLVRPIRPQVMDPVLRRFATLATLAPNEIALVERLAGQREECRAGAELLAEGATVRPPRLIVSGWAVRQRLLPDGRRQIFSFLVPGDGVGFCLRPHPLALAATIALTRVETVDASSIRLAAKDPEAHPGLTRILETAGHIDEARLLDNVVRLGRQTAYERVAHLLLELRDRLVAAGLADERRFPLPATQEVLADALGLSVVHINRILQQLRREKLIELHSGRVVLLNPDLLTAISDYRAAK
ncbi:MAG TPA: helix-turn-helix domain-containing protein [Caulobacteraceae bacterium]|jgi:CRP-like cAMP-binding protein|nr:helix-turn-helix domain-containing protein [Caulobacteraceae bacterium]